MCPSAPISELLDFKACSTDEDYVLFLGAMEVGDPIPENMIIDVNPCMVEPWSSPGSMGPQKKALASSGVKHHHGNQSSTENRWYLYSLEDQRENGENNIKVTKNGHWKIIDAHRILSIGKKTILEFYEGQTPCGKKTGWMMHVYQAEQKAQGFNTAQNYCYLSRVFLQSGQSSNSEELGRYVNADLHYDQLESYLLCLAEQEENNFLSEEAIDKSQMVLGAQHKVTDSADERTTENSAEEMRALYDISREDFLEMNDLLSLDSSSTSSDNSINMSINSDEYFDADALLRDLQNENAPSMEVERADCRFSISSSVQPNQVIVCPPKPGLVRDHGSDIMVAESMPGNSVPDDGQGSHQTVSLPTTGLHNREGAYPFASSQDSQVNRTVSEGSQGSKFPLLTTGLQHNEGASPYARLQNSRVNRTLSESSQDRKPPLPTIGLPHNEGASPSSSSENSRVNHTLSESSQDSKSPRGQGTRSVSKIAKLGKYCCFVSFCP